MSKLTGRVQTGHCQVGACSCNCRKDVASKHWLWLQTLERQGTSIRKVDRGHFNDMMDDVATISLSSARLLTAQILAPYLHMASGALTLGEYALLGNFSVAGFELGHEL